EAVLAVALGEQVVGVVLSVGDEERPTGRRDRAGVALPDRDLEVGRDGTAGGGADAQDAARLVDQEDLDVGGAGDLGRALDDPLEHDVEVQPGHARPGGADERGELLVSPDDLFGAALALAD